MGSATDFLSGGKTDVNAPTLPGLPDAPEFGATTPELLEQQALSTILNTAYPFGSSTSTGSAEEGFTRSTELSPELQNMFASITAPDAGQAYTQSYYDRAMNLLRPELDRQMKAEDVMLAQRGLPVGSELRSDIESASARSRNEALENLALSAIMQGENQKNRDVQQFLQMASGIESAAGPQINTLASYQMPYQAEVLPYMQEIARQNLQYSGDLSAAQQNSQNKTEIKSGLFDAGTSAATAGMGG